MAPSPSHSPQTGLSIATRFYFLLAATSLPILGGFYLYAVRATQKYIDEVDGFLVDCYAYRVESVIEETPVGGIGSPQRQALKRELEDIVNEPSGIDSISVFYAGEGGHLQYLAGFGPYAPDLAGPAEREAVAQNQPVWSSGPHGSPHLRNVYVPLRHQQAIRGAISMVVGPNIIGPAALDRRLDMVFRAVLLLLAMGICMALFLHFAVRRPVRRLIDAVEATSTGDFRTLPERGGGEFGRLAHAFNRMAERLQQGQQENQNLFQQTRDYNEDLRRRVREATEALSAKNDQLQGANEKLLQIQRQMMALEKLATIGQISSTIAHELGTPLNAIACHLHLFLQNPGTDPARIENLRTVETQIGRLTDIVRGILDAWQIPPPRFDRADVNGVVSDVANLLYPLFQKRRVNLDLRLTRSLPKIPVDADQMRQVLINLFTNAMDAMPNGGALTVSTAFMPSEGNATAAASPSSGRSDRVRITVADTGEGMDAETLQRLFEPFRMMEAVGSRGDAAGIGLGLPICLHIVKAHNGEIAATSRKGHGTVFTIDLPVRNDGDLTPAP
jgi:signal transduction histidine kinase